MPTVRGLRIKYIFFVTIKLKALLRSLPAEVISYRVRVEVGTCTYNKGYRREGNGGRGVGLGRGGPNNKNTGEREKRGEWNLGGEGHRREGGGMGERE